VIGVKYMSDKPVASFVLVLIAAIIDFIIGIIILAGGSVVAAMVSRGLGASWIAGIIMMFAVWWIICGALLFLSSMWINSGEPGKVRNGGIIAIIFGILSLNILVIILSIIGGVLALTWKPPRRNIVSGPPEQGEAEEVI